jgi:hypothetical protein
MKTLSRVIKVDTAPFIYILAFSYENGDWENVSRNYGNIVKDRPV